MAVRIAGERRQSELRPAGVGVRRCCGFHADPVLYRPHETRHVHDAAASAAAEARGNLRRRPRSGPACRPARLLRGARRRTRHGSGGERHFVPDVPREPRARHEEHRAGQRHHQHAEHAPGAGCGAGGDDRSPAEGPLHHGHQSRRPDVGRRGLRQLQEGPQRHLPRIDQHGARHLGREPPYNLSGQFFSVTTANTQIPEIGQGAILKPYQKPHPPIVVTAVAPHSKGVTEAAKRGWTPISANFLLPEWVASHWPRYEEGCKAAQKEAQPSDWRVAKSIFVADDDKVAKRYGHGPGGPYHFYFKQLIRKLVGFGGRSNLFKLDPSQPDSSITADTITPKLVLAGAVGSVVDQILAFRETTGDFGTLYYACHDWVDPALGRRSMQLMAEQVMPRVNTAIAKSGVNRLQNQVQQG